MIDFLATVGVAMPLGVVLLLSGVWEVLCVVLQENNNNGIAKTSNPILHGMEKRIFMISIGV